MTATATAQLTATPLPARPTSTPIHTSELNLLRVTISEIPANLPAYDRHDWKHRTDPDGDCQDTRNEVLIAESPTTVTYRIDRECRVAAGEWLAPYSSTVVTDPSKLDVDHMVPLGNAHDSGAWQWTAEQKERYANYLEDPQHLIAVTASANRSKGARGPDQWKPEDRSYWCRYAVDWATIKDDWNPTVTEQEHGALVEMLNTCAKRPQLTVSRQSRAGPTPGPTGIPARPTPMMTSYSSCDAAQTAGETRVQGSKGAAEDPRSGWRPAPETAMGTATCANDERPDASRAKPPDRSVCAWGLIKTHSPQCIGIPGHNIVNPRRQAAKIIGRRGDQSSGKRPAFI